MPNIIKKVLKDHKGITDFEIKLFRSGEYREYYEQQYGRRLA